MNGSVKWMMSVGVSVACLLLSTGCATANFAKNHQTDGTVIGSKVAGFYPLQTVREVKQVIQMMGYRPAPRRGAEAMIGDLLDESKREQYVGETIVLDGFDSKTSRSYGVGLIFNEQFTLEKIIVTFWTRSKGDCEILEFYLEKYPMLVFLSKDSGQDFNRRLQRREISTIADYHFQEKSNAYIHLNHRRNEQEDGWYKDVVTFNLYAGSEGEMDASGQDDSSLKTWSER